ncbi:unnamed protein product [Caenorhabditis bovis]|uniref:Uncharacterized protein n=1 Tax=Caenorhabditis bovis TaxID=2654633 RepID=A0A8S1EWW3_9PELO|nr:unnamed protein product [Caenorhabditis bovis]
MPIYDTSSSSDIPRGSMRIDWNRLFPRLTSKTLLSHYLPASGAISHTLYTVHLFSPKIISNLFPTGDLAVSNTILFNANVGLGFYVYFRRHLQHLHPWERVEFSVLTSTIFNFGTLLAAVLIKALFPAKSRTWVKTIAATSLSVYLLTRAYKYLGVLDTKPTKTAGSVASPSSVKCRARRGSRSVVSRAASVLPDASISYTEEIARDSPIDDRNVLMTPSVTNASTTEGDLMSCTTDDVNMKSTKPNFRYLHSFALNNLNQTRPAKADILRRAVQNNAEKPLNSRRTSNTQISFKPTTPTCFVTPEPSLKDVSAVYTPPPSRLVESHYKKPKRVVRHEKDELDRVIDMAQWHAHLVMVPIAFTCFITESMPLIDTLRFIFYG